MLQSLLGGTLWRMPFPFQVAKLAGPRYTLRCLLFHDISDRTSAFTEGLNVTIGKEEFESRIKFISKYYSPIDLQDFIEASQQNALPPRPVLITFDDAYESVAMNAAPVLHHYKIPAVFFVVSSTVGNEELGLDNLICYIANTQGMKVINSAAKQTCSSKEAEYETLEQVFDHLLPTMPLKTIRNFRDALATSARIHTRDLAREAQLYVTSEQLRSLASDGFEIGNHTLSHVFCRSLANTEFAQEILDNKARLEHITGRTVRAFSVPYGSPIDLTAEVAQYLSDSGHEAVFLARSRSNTPATSLTRLNRVDIHAGSDADTFAEIEILPRLRSFVDILRGEHGPFRKFI